jgi:hypothetical protein
MKRLNLDAFMCLSEKMGMRVEPHGNRTPLGIPPASVYLESFVTRVLKYFMQRLVLPLNVLRDDDSGLGDEPHHGFRHKLRLATHLVSI